MNICKYLHTGTIQNTRHVHSSAKLDCTGLRGCNVFQLKILSFQEIVPGVFLGPYAVATRRMVRKMFIAWILYRLSVDVYIMYLQANLMKI